MSETRPIGKRLGEALAALLMWLVFGLFAVALLVLFPLLVARYVALGTQEARDAVKRPGKSLDQLANAAFFGGHPKETISSHAGRWLLEARDRAPWWVFVVERVTEPFEENHVFKAIEAPFLGMPLTGKGDR